MRWVPSPTDAYSDLRLAEAGEKAEILHRRAWDWCGHHETDAVIPHAMLARLCPAGWKARLKALLAVGMWEPVDGGASYRLVAWVPVLSEMRSLQRRKDSDAERARRYRATKPNRDASRTSGVDASRDASRESPLAEEKRDNPPNPPHSGGDDEPIPPTWTPGSCYRHPDKPGKRCRRCGTTDRQLAEAAAEREAAEAAAELADLVERRDALDWCGGEDCDPKFRKLKVPGGLVKCPHCHPDVVVGPLPAERPALTVVGRR